VAGSAVHPFVNFRSNQDLDLLGFQPLILAADVLPYCFHEFGLICRAIAKQNDFTLVKQNRDLTVSKRNRQRIDCKNRT
jgi:hypothetical protein